MTLIRLSKTVLTNSGNPSRTAELTAFINLFRRNICPLFYFKILACGSDSTETKGKLMSLGERHNKLYCMWRECNFQEQFNGNPDENFEDDGDIWQIFHHLEYTVRLYSSK